MLRLRRYGVSPAFRLARRLIVLCPLVLTLNSCTDTPDPVDLELQPDLGRIKVPRLSVRSGNNQSGPTGSTLPSPLVVRARSGPRNVEGVTVDWNVASGDAILSTTKSTTDADGEARTEVTFGDVPGAVTVEFVGPDQRVGVFNLTAFQAPPDDEVEPPAPIEVAVTPDQVTVNAIGDQVTLSAAVVQADTTLQLAVTWTTLDPQVATVGSSGQVTTLAAGSARIAASAAGAADTAVVQVPESAEPPAPIEITVTPDFVSVNAIGDQVTLSAAVLQADTTLQLPVTWTSLDPQVATVNSSGRVTTQAAGSARIAASALGAADTALVQVPQASDPPPPPPPPPGTLPAFPGAQGWGADALEDCRSLPLQVLTVTSTAADGPGTFARAVSDVSTDHFTFILFETGGHFDTPADGIRLQTGCVYIAGQTAPGDGIVVQGHSTGFWIRGWSSSLSDVVMRYIRFRGKAGQTSNNMIIARGKRVVLDHMSFSWADNYPLAVLRYASSSYSGLIHDLSIQRSIVSEGFASHATGLTLNTDATLKSSATVDMSNISIHQNLMANNSHRNPMTAADNALVANNVVYNWRLGAGMMNRRGTVDWVNNHAKSGPMQKADGTFTVTPYCDEYDGSFSVYASGNIGPQNSSGSGDNWSGSTREVACYRGTGDYAGQPIPSAWRRNSEQSWRSAPVPLQLMSASQTFTSVTQDVGANARITCDGRWTGAMDPVDSRVISETLTGNGVSTPPVSESSVGGYPSYSRGSACPDQDNDGLPDDWERRYYNCPTCADPAAQGGLGYLLIEHYVNGTDPT